MGILFVANGLSDSVTMSSDFFPLLLPLFLSLPLALVLDRMLGEPGYFHPLVGLGRIAKAVERHLNREQHRFFTSRMLGVLALLIVLGPMVWLALTLTSYCTQSTAGAVLFGGMVLYLVIGAQSLSEHAQAIKEALMRKDLNLARTRVGYIVSRETVELDEVGVAKATIESVLENGSDAIFAPIFWFVVAGPVGAVAYRVINTLDAMWGYRNARFHAFGWAAARLDDVVNWVPARLCALTYAIVASRNPCFDGKNQCFDGKRLGLQGLQAWQQQAPLCESPNAGPVMACGAGALNLELGGSARYHGNEVWRPVLGQGFAPVAEDIDRTLLLLKRGVYLWLFAITGVIGLTAVMLT